MAKRVKTFTEVDGFDYTNRVGAWIKETIEGKPKDYILKVDENEFVDYIVAETKIEPLAIDYNSERIEQPRVSVEKKQSRMYDRTYNAEVYNIDVTYNYTGDGVLFEIRPNRFTMTTAEVTVNDSAKTVQFTIKLTEKSPEEFEKRKQNTRQSAFTNIDNANAFAEQFNNNLRRQAQSTFRTVKQKYLAENDFFEKIKVRVNKDTDTVFNVQTVRKKAVVQPSVDGDKEFASSPAIAQSVYDDILNVTYSFGKSMEKKPGTYRGKDEEELRDQFLLILETRYEGVTATGETFNKRGKTDILLKYSPDNTNLFVAECKVWHGQSEMKKAITQLFDRYLTWRDSKTAMIMFVPTVSFATVLESMKSAVVEHPYFVKECPPKGESSFSYIMHLPNDPTKEVQMQVIAFHFNEK